MKILLTNDDGVYSPGLHALRTVLEEAHEVWVIAPDRNRSACSAALHLESALRLEELAPRVYSCTGTPANCVLLSTMEGFFFRPDFVVSGMNLGQNLGGDIWHSGTVAAARQAAYYGIPAIAFSLSFDEQPFHIAEAASCVAHFFQEWQELCKAPCFLNVNIPNRKTPTLQYKITHPMTSTYRSKATLQRMSKQSWIVRSSAQVNPADKDPNGDRSVVEEGITSVSILSADAFRSSCAEVSAIEL